MFSEKYGYKKEKQILHETVSDTLRQRVWNLFYMQDIKKGGLWSGCISASLKGEPYIEAFVADKLGLTVSYTTNSEVLLKKIENYLLVTSSWYDVYDFIEFHISFLENEKRVQRIQQYNMLLEEEKSGYRVVNAEIAPITNRSEIETIEQASNTEFLSVNEHMQKALSLYADIKNPDYENSIKDSICAVESMCCIITGMIGKGATLGAAIKKLKDNGVHIHPAMENAFSSLYGYTSDENGIRHGGIDFTNASAEDAKYMLVSCSAFVNYLIEKWSKVNSTE